MQTFGYQIVFPLKITNMKRHSTPVFVKMPNRDSIVNTALQTTNLRRSPRFFHAKNIRETEQPTTTLRKSQRFVNREKSAAESANPRTPKPKARRRSVVYSLNSSLSYKKSSKANSGSIKSPRSNNGVEGFQSLRRSSRILNRQRVVVEERKALIEKVPEKLGEFENGFINNSKLSPGSRKSPRLTNSADGFRSLRRSLRFCNEESVVDEHTGKAKCARSKSKANSCLNKEELSGVGKDGARVKTTDRVSRKSKKATRRSSVGSEVVRLEGSEKKVEELDDGNREVGVRRKRKRDEGGIRAVQGWTKEHELALQRAYLIAKPTPHFWKKVSKLVPGKSAQECYDRVQSEHITPPQQRTRSRAKILTNRSPLEQFSVSASKLLKPAEPKAKRTSCNKHRGHPAHVRKLLQKHYEVYQDYEADLFSVLEPSLGPSTDTQPSAVLSTPTNLQEKQGLLQKCSQRSSSDHKKPLSRFSSSGRTPLVSPRVLKQVRNKVWHEKYIDQLHNREAKRKAAFTSTQKSTVGIEDIKKSHSREVDVVRTAKVALVSDARDAINKLQPLQANAMENSSDLDG